MPFFKNSKKKIISGDGTETTIIAKDTKINGHIDTTCNLHIDGHLDGDIVSNGLVIVGESGLVKSDVVTEKLIVSGKIEGNIIAKIVEILPSGSIIGNVTSEEFIIEKDGIFEGESHHQEFKPVSTSIDNQQSKIKNLDKKKKSHNSEQVK